MFVLLVVRDCEYLKYVMSIFQMNGICSWGDFVYTCGIDDSLRQINIEGNSYTDAVVKLNCQPRGIAIFREQNIIALSCVKEITLVQVNIHGITDSSVDIIVVYLFPLLGQS